MTSQIHEIMQKSITNPAETALTAPETRPALGRARRRAPAMLPSGHADPASRPSPPPDPPPGPTRSDEEVMTLLPVSARAGQTVSSLRRQVEVVIRRAAFLTRKDRALVLGAFDKGMDVPDLARLLGVCPSTVRRRLSRILRRLAGPTFDFVLTNRSRWSHERRRVAEMRMLQGRPLREIVERTGLSMHEVRRHDAALRAQFELAYPQRSAAQ